MNTTPSKPAQTINDVDPAPPQKFKNKLGLSWQLWGAILVVVSGAIGYFATVTLLKLSPAPNCATIYFPMASASSRLYCAQLEAEKGGVENLLNAIASMDKIPSDHPLQKTIQEYREEWADQILALGEKEFQEGKLNEAIAIAQKIPFNSQAYKLVEEQIKTWREIWAKGETLMSEAEANLKASEWNQAFGNAVSLTNLKNRYWAVTKYEELISKINLAREESSKLDAAYAALRRDDADSLLKAIEVAGEFEPNSYAYKEAQELIDNAKNKLLKKMQYFVDNRQWNTLSRIANKIPSKVNLQEQVMDWNYLANAGIKANIGTLISLEEAIKEAQKISVGNFLYQDAQELISQWQSETEAVVHLNQARQYAQGSNKGNYQAAIAEASLIPSTNPRYDEAQGEIRSWSRQIAVIEDQPILDLARQWARGGNADSLQRAIEQARLIGVNRPLHSEAKNLISKWQSEIQIQQDRPILDQAIAFGNAQDFYQAIQVAERIGSSRALYSEAQGKIRNWSREIQGSENLQKAYRIAASGTPQDLAQAIRQMQNVPANTRVSSQASQMSNRWSYQILALAQEQANISLQDAINMAKLIPSYTAAYNSAQAQIQGWENILKPPVFVPESIPLL
jgi:hypothetical protein